MTSVAVLGLSGMLGSHLVQKLDANPEFVVSSFDRSSIDFEKPIDDLVEKLSGFDVVVN